MIQPLDKSIGAMEDSECTRETGGGLKPSDCYFDSCVRPGFRAGAWIETISELRQSHSTARASTRVLRGLFSCPPLEFASPQEKNNGRY